jgi:hypothetical protein
MTSLKIFLQLDVGKHILINKLRVEWTQSYSLKKTHTVYRSSKTQHDESCSILVHYNQTYLFLERFEIIFSRAWKCENNLQ